MAKCPLWHETKKHNSLWLVLLCCLEKCISLQNLLYIMKGPLLGKVAGWHPKIMGSYFRQYLIIWRKKPMPTKGLPLGYRASKAQSHGGSHQWEHPHTHKKVSKSKFSCLQVPHLPCLFFVNPQLGLKLPSSCPASWRDKASFLDRNQSLPLQPGPSGLHTTHQRKTFFILYLLPLHSFPFWILLFFKY